MARLFANPRPPAGKRPCRRRARERPRERWCVGHDDLPVLLGPSLCPSFSAVMIRLFYPNLSCIRFSLSSSLSQKSPLLGMMPLNVLNICPEMFLYVEEN